MVEQNYFQESLKSELNRRCKKNGRYSLRAFSRALGVDAPALSRILSGKIIPSPRMAKKIVNQIDCSPDEKHLFVSSVVAARQSRKLNELKDLMPSSSISEASTKILEIDRKTFEVISDWYHYAILELTFTKDFKYDLRWISSRLGISQIEAKMALERLVDLGLLKKFGSKFIKTDLFITTKDHDTTAPALKRRQKQMLEKAIESLENDPIEVRNNTTITMAIDPAKIPEARKRIRDFGRSLCKFLENGSQKEIYELSTNLFPLSKRRNEK